MTTTLAALGCGTEQAFAIAEARAAGFRVVGVDGNASCAGADLCDTFLHVDLRDERAVLEALKPFPVEAVLPAPIGRLLTTAGAVNDALGLRGVSRACAERCADKAAFHQALLHAGLERGWQLPITDWSEVPFEELALRLPVVFKPRHGSGSRGVRVASTPDDLVRFRTELAREPFDAWLCEPFVEGQEYGADGWVTNGRVTLVALRRKQLTEVPFRQVISYRAGPSLGAELWTRVESLMQRVAAAVGHADGLFHSDLIQTPSGELHVIEYAGRAAGLLMSERLAPLVSGVPFLLGGVHAVLGRPPMRPPVPGGIREACLQFLRLPPGPVDTLHRLSTSPPRAACHIQAQPGDQLRPIQSGQDVLDRGWVLTWSEEGDVGEAEARRVYDEALSIEARICDAER